ncbi:Ubiquitin- modifier 1 [Coemansia sp. RSA 2050]|nr:Ubiquitin- modifier 1 [Coemansia sp. RSA 2050]KAJ2733612.1 Ubiquitin- modifier 1 [Coemansia sp. BCRC 34962]
MSSIEKGKDSEQPEGALIDKVPPVDTRKYFSVVTKSLDKDKEPLAAKDAASSKTDGPSLESSLHVITKFSGGMELLIKDKKQGLDHVFEVNTKAEPINMKDLLKYVGETQVVEGKQSAFSEDGTIRPGIMVIINECDWEVMGELEYVLQNDDEVEFISTLHGG